MMLVLAKEMNLWKMDQARVYKVRRKYNIMMKEGKVGSQNMEETRRLQDKGGDLTLKRART